MPKKSSNVNEHHMTPTGIEPDHERNLDLSPIAHLNTALDDLDLSTNPDDSGIFSEGEVSVEDARDYDDSDQEDGYVIQRYQFTQEDKALFDQRKGEEINGPDQRHLEILSKAFRAIPTSEFAFGDVISNSQVNTAKLVLRVWKKGSPRQTTPKKLTPVKKSKKNKKGKTKRMESDESDEDDDEPPVTPTRINDKEAELSFPFSPDSFKTLSSFTSISSFGKGNKNVIEPEYRQAKEIKPEGFELKPDPMARSDILARIAKRMNLRCKLRAEVAKLNVYDKGGFFKSHCDTPRGTEHIGTLVIGLPSTYQGGALVVDHAGHKVRFDWGEEWNRSKTATTQLHWAFLYGDCEHEVEEVTFGSRLTVAYDIYTTSGPSDKSRPPSSQSDALASKLKDALQDRKGFAKDGCTLAFGLGHSYPKTTDVGVEEAFWRHFEHRLKGTDAVLLDAVKKCNLDFSFKAAFLRNMDGFDYPDDEMRIFAQLRSHISYGLRGLDQASFTKLYDQLEEQLSNLRVRKGLRKYQVMLADRPDRMEGEQDYDFGDLRGPTPMDRLNVETRDGPNNLVWVDYPTNYGFQNNYEFAGNDAGDGVVVYSGVALLVDIPAANRR